jgi:hypothetical protein
MQMQYEENYSGVRNMTNSGVGPALSDDSHKSPGNPERGRYFQQQSYGQQRSSVQRALILIIFTEC